MNLQQYKGMNIDEAKTKAIESGLLINIERDGFQVLNQEFIQNRITFRVENNVVVEARLG